MLFRAVEILGLNLSVCHIKCLSLKYKNQLNLVKEHQYSVFVKIVTLKTDLICSPEWLWFDLISVMCFM